MGISDQAVNRMSAAMMELQYSLHTEMPPAGEVQAEGYRRLSGREAGVTAEPSIDGFSIKMLRATPGRIRLPPDGWGAPGYIGAYTARRDDTGFLDGDG